MVQMEVLGPILIITIRFILGCRPAQDAIVTTRIIIFLVGDPNLNFHLPLLPGGGTAQGLSILQIHLLVQAQLPNAKHRKPLMFPCGVLTDVNIPALVSL